MEIDFSYQVRLYCGLYEMELNRAIRRLARTSRRAFDVGGHVGYDALVLAKISRGHVASFERLASYAATMERNFAANPALDPLLQAEHTSVGEQSADGFLRLDDFAAEWGNPDLIKVDVDGGELSVLRGAERILRESRPSLVVETHSEDLELGCASFLRELGYSLRVLDHRRLLRDYRPLAHNRWLIAEPGRS